MIQISNWYGRLGNNIIQLANAIDIGVSHNKSEVVVPEHRFLIGTKLYGDDDTIMSGEFYYEKVHNRNTTLPILKKCFNGEMLPPIVFPKKNEIICYIRSGDKDSHSDYIDQPTFNFYSEIIDYGKYDSVRIISEDYKSPVINQLVDKYNAIYQKQTLEKDIAYIMNCEAITFGYSTFAPSLLLFNEKIKPNHIYPYPRAEKDFPIIKTLLNK